MVVNPMKFANQFREELIADLELVPSLCCPKCVITYVDGNYEGNCFYADTRGKKLQCVYDFDGGTMKEAISEWIDGVLKCLRGKDDELVAKWRARLTV
jgi:hypothetical protein